MLFDPKPLSPLNLTGRLSNVQYFTGQHFRYLVRIDPHFFFQIEEVTDVDRLLTCYLRLNANLPYQNKLPLYELEMLSLQMLSMSFSVATFSLLTQFSVKKINN